MEKREFCQESGVVGACPEDDLLPLSALQHLLFCERRCALVHIEQVWEENRFTAEGRILHERVDGGEAESRGGVRIARALSLRSLRLGLSGKADVVEFHRDDQGGELRGDTIPIKTGKSGHVPLSSGWRPYPVEYKRGKPKTANWDQVQLCAQALCLEEMLVCTIHEGALFYGQTRRRQLVCFDDALRRETEEAAARLHQLVRSGVTPPAHYEKKCDSCSLVQLCLPKIAAKGKSVGRYLARMLAEGGNI